MKKILIFVLFGLLSFSAAQASPKKDELLTRKQAKAVLATIDDQCSDSWCEGDFDYSFDWIGCKASLSRCVLRFTMKDMADNGRVKNQMSAVCVISDVRSVDQIMDKYGLNQDFYGKLDGCISKREDEFHKKIGNR